MGLDAAGADYSLAAGVVLPGVGLSGCRARGSTKR